MSQPIVVGDRIYVGSGMTDLLCLDKATGKILWLRSNTPYDAMTDEQRGAPGIKEQIGQLAPKLNAINDEAVKAINELYQRDDDKAETVKHRIHVYLEQNSPLISYYRDHGKLVEIDGMQSIEQVTQDLLVALKKL